MWLIMKLTTLGAHAADLSGSISHECFYLLSSISLTIFSSGMRDATNVRIF
jgi:hypothetical protein